MSVRDNFDGALHFTKLSVNMACTWPPSRNATKRETFKYNVAWCVSFLSCFCLFVPLVVSMFKYKDNSLVVTQSACFVGATSNLMFKMIVYRIHIKRTQWLISEMEDFVEKAEPHEEIILQRYIDRCSSFHAFISLVNYIAAAMVIAGPMLIPGQPFPTSAAYPFSVDNGIIMYLVYVHQSIAGFQCSSGVTVDCQSAFMMWFAGARLEILADELKSVNDLRQFELFVSKHRGILTYALDVSDTMSYIAIASSTACGIAAIMSSVQLCGDQPIAVKMQFGPVALIATLNLFICAWPAENLINVCDNLSNAVYNAPWIEMPLSMKKNFLFLLQKCQRAIIVSVAGFLPTLSLNSYASFLSAVFSYFTTLRLVVTSSDEK